jgi:hypothetical protein
LAVGSAAVPAAVRWESSPAAPVGALNFARLIRPHRRVKSFRRFDDPRLRNA